MNWLNELTLGSKAALACTVSSRAMSAARLAERIWGLLARARSMASSRVRRRGALGEAAGGFCANAPWHKARPSPTINGMCGIGGLQYRNRDMNRRWIRLVR